MTVFLSEKQKPRSEDDLEILLRVIWSSLAVRWGLEVEKEILKSFTERRLVRGKQTQLVRSFMNTPYFSLGNAFFDGLVRRVLILNANSKGFTMVEGLEKFG